MADTQEGVTVVVTTTGPALAAAETLKFRVLSDGVAISDAAQRYIDENNEGRPMTPADYASTSGIILELDTDVWVNAPISLYNANFVTDTAYVLDLDEAGLLVRGDGLSARARFWLPPAYHGRSNPDGDAYNSYAFTHGDRVRISPIEGCAMACQFCNLPYDFKYRRKLVEGLVDSVKVAAADPVQPAAHVLISGGTPRQEDFEYVKECYEAVITGCPELPVDVMMVPYDGLLDVPWLDSIGVRELSINIEIFDQARARRIIRRKHDMQLDYYLSFIERAAETLGPGRVRSMLLVGVESLESTLAGVEALAARGAVPVLSPFRPDPSTPMEKELPPTAAVLEEAFLRASDIAARYDVPLGPDCLPCSHNTVTLAASGAGSANTYYGRPRVV